MFIRQQQDARHQHSRTFAGVSDSQRSFDEDRSPETSVKKQAKKKAFPSRKRVPRAQLS